MTIYHSKIEKKQFDKLINIDTGYKNPISDFKSGRIEINNDFSVLSKSVHVALIEQQNKAFKDYLNKIGCVPHSVYKLHEELGNLEKENENNNSWFPIF